MKVSTAKVVVFVLIISASNAENNSTVQFIDYYWRDYTGIVPDDAVPGGLDLNHQPTYIGQGFVKDRGNIPGVIYPGQKEISVPIYGVVKIDTYIKILCSHKTHAFKWVAVKSPDFNIKTIDKVLVIGGLEDNNLLYIGRIAFQGKVITGKIVTNLPGLPELASMCFVHRNKEIPVYSYEMLVYDDDLVRDVKSVRR